MIYANAKDFLLLAYCHYLRRFL